MTAKHHPSAVRRTFRTAYFTEGWGLYAEQMMREQGFFTDKRQEMCQFEAMLFRAARIIVDTSLHTGEMSFDEAVEYMQHEGRAARADRARRGRALLLVADAGRVVPDWVPGDPAHPRRVLHAARR